MKPQQSTFIFKDGDECSFPKSGLLFLMSNPTLTEKTKRFKHYLFPFNFKRFADEIEYLNVESLNDDTVEIDII